MAKKDDLRIQRAGTIINATSKQQETSVVRALEEVVDMLRESFPKIALHHEKEWLVADVIRRLRVEFPDVPFAEAFARSAMRPDGGILSIKARDDGLHPILIIEVKNQGTNDLRLAEGLKRQAKGNAIERLGKNVIGFRSALLSEAIVPFVCFGYGCDFADDSSILDRVVTIAMFGPLNQISVMNEGENKQFNRGSFFFREEEWSIAEMVEIMFEVATRSIHYYYAKHGAEVLETIG